MKKIPTGVEDFKKIIDQNYFYIDKSLFIKDVIYEDFALYTRPRRFGKTLNMSMLNYFFSINEKDNAYLFDGLEISKDKEVMKHQNQYPVIYITLKEMKGTSYDEQIDNFTDIITDLYDQHHYIENSNRVTRVMKNKFTTIYEGQGTKANLKNSLKILSTCLYQHFNKKVIILIDEYDVPLSDAYSNGYFDDMSTFISGVFSAGLKTNKYLEKGVFTGCLRISKESIFTGLNNFNVYSITENRSSDRFGFTLDEVQKLCHYYSMDDKIETIKEWYDGYLFGNTEIYNPWSVLKYIDQTMQGIYDPISFWANTSGNDIVKEYIEKANNQLHDEFELLIQGEYIEKKVLPELTYREMDRISNIYSFLLFTGYLKIHKIIDRSYNIYELEIPNKEIKEIYINLFNEWFNDYTDSKIHDLFEALNTSKENTAMDLLNDILESSISYYDNYESFYHGFIIGLFSGYKIESNKESGKGRFDISILPKRITGNVIIIECKHSDSLAHLIDDSIEATQQIIDKKYISGFKKRGYQNVLGYGIAFYKKTCYITRLQSQ